VNAEDFGLTEGINQGIFEAHRRRILTSATLMAIGPAFDSAVALAKDSPQLGRVCSATPAERLDSRSVVWKLQEIP